jgi:hypothetical protein
MGEEWKRPYQVGNAAAKLFAFRARLIEYEIRSRPAIVGRGQGEGAGFMTNKRAIA